MKSTPLANYSLVAASRQVTLTDVPTVRLDRLMAIINVTRGVTYYAAGDTTLLATVSGSVVTFNASVSVTGHADADKLIALYDDGLVSASETTLVAQTALLGAVNETAPASDTASAGQNGRLQRIAQRLTSLIAQLPATLGIQTAANSLSTAPASGATWPVSGTVGVTGVATETTLVAQTALMGAVTETAPASDTASSGQNGRLQRIAQRLTTLITTLTDRTQRSQITDGTNEATVSTTIADGVAAAINRLRVSAVNMVFNGTTVDIARGGVIGETGAATGYANVIPATGAVVGASRVNSTAYEASRVIKASGGTLISLSGYNSRTTNQFIQLFNSTSLPADGVAPVAVFIAYSQTNFSYDVPITGTPFTTGIVVSNSTTGPTKTIGAADCYFTAVIK